MDVPGSAIAPAASLGRRAETSQSPSRVGTYGTFVCRCYHTVVLRIALFFAAASHAQDWAQWRGPSRTGEAAAFSAPSRWPSQLEKLWSAPAGGGYSTPVVSAAAVFLFSRDGEQEVVSAFDRVSGKPLWRHSYAARFRQNQYASAMGRGPHSTPLYHDGRLYTLGIMGALTCLDARTGAVVWRKDFSSRIDTGKLFTGTAMSPLIDSGLLIVTVGDDSKASLMALDPTTGAPRWNWQEDGAGYASPVVAEWYGVRQVVTLTDRRAVSLSLRDGKLLWSVPFKDQWIENIVTPVISGNRVVFSGVRLGTVCVEVKQQGGQWKAEPVWQSAGLTMYMSSPVLAGGHLYGMTNKKKGQLFCAEVATGKVLWTTAGREGTNVSLVGAGEHLLALNETGDLRVARRSPSGFQPVAELKVADSATWAQPLVLGRNLLIRDASSITMYRMP